MKEPITLPVGSKFLSGEWYYNKSMSKAIIDALSFDDINDYKDLNKILEYLLVTKKKQLFIPKNLPNAERIISFCSSIYNSRIINNNDWIILDFNPHNSEFFESVIKGYLQFKDFLPSIDFFYFQFLWHKVFYTNIGNHTCNYEWIEYKCNKIVWYVPSWYLVLYMENNQKVIFKFIDGKLVKFNYNWFDKFFNVYIEDDTIILQLLNQDKLLILDKNLEIISIEGVNKFRSINMLDSFGYYVCVELKNKWNIPEAKDVVKLERNWKKYYLVNILLKQFVRLPEQLRWYKHIAYFHKNLDEKSSICRNYYYIILRKGICMRYFLFNPLRNNFIEINNINEVSTTNFHLFKILDQIFVDTWNIINSIVDIWGIYIVNIQGKWRFLEILDNWYKFITLEYNWREFSEFDEPIWPDKFTPEFVFKLDGKYFIRMSGRFLHIEIDWEEVIWFDFVHKLENYIIVWVWKRLFKLSFDFAYFYEELNDYYYDSKAWKCKKK